MEESELWGVSELEEFKIKLANGKGKADVIDMAGWMEGHSLRE